MEYITVLSLVFLMAFIFLVQAIKERREEKRKAIYHRLCSVIERDKRMMSSISE